MADGECVMADDEWAGDKPSAVETAVPGQAECGANSWERRIHSPAVCLWGRWALRDPQTYV